MLPDEELQLGLHVDWDRIVKDFVPTRTAVDCLTQWSVHQHPSINTSPIDEQELSKIIQIAQRYQFSDWIAIATEVGTNRTALQCMTAAQRYRFTHVRRAWSMEEDELLREAVRAYGERNWQHVSSFLGNRTAQQCLHRWTKALNPTIRRGKWTEDEDNFLKTAVALYGFENEAKAKTMNWSKIATHVPGRTDVQCRERYMNCLLENLNRAPFTAKEDKHLLDLVAKHGAGKWSMIAQELGTHRTDNACWRRYKALMFKEGKSPWERANDPRSPSGKPVAIHQRTVERLKEMSAQGLLKSVWPISNNSPRKSSRHKGMPIDSSQTHYSSSEQDEAS